MDEAELLAQHFEQARPRLRGVAYRMLGSAAEAEDAVQDAWLRVSRADTSVVENMNGWLTTIVARVCLNMLQSRKARREDLVGPHLPDLVVTRESVDTPEEQSVLADSVGVALLVVLEVLTPAERLAFVLHDMFGVPFRQIASILDSTPAAARQLASRARRRVRQAPVEVDTDAARTRRVVDAFVAASRNGDFAALVAVLDPDVVLHADTGSADFGVARVVQGAEGVAAQARTFASLASAGHRVRVNGAPGLAVLPAGRLFAILSFAVRQDRIVQIDILADPERLAGIDVAPLLG